jgi:hypothetical protein
MTFAGAASRNGLCSSFPGYSIQYTRYVEMKTSS